MNFPDNPEGRRVAASIPIGHKSLVYLMHPVKRIWAAIEYIKWDVCIADVLEEGMRAAVAQGAVAMMEAHSAKFAKVWRCIRFLAVIDDCAKSPPIGRTFQQGNIMVEIEPQDFYEMFKAVPWSWVQAGDEA
jgi:hypothetical protein